jgi:hypothetical protein
MWQQPSTCGECGGREACEDHFLPGTTEVRHMLFDGVYLTLLMCPNALLCWTRSLLQVSRAGQGPQGLNHYNEWVSDALMGFTSYCLLCP